MPQASSNGMVAAEIYSPQTLRRGDCVFSIKATRQPASASRRAAVLPAGPGPTTAAPTGIFMRDEHMGEGKARTLLAAPAGLRPECGQFPVLETGADADHRVVAGYGIGANPAQLFGGKKRKGRAARLAGDEEAGAGGGHGEKAAKGVVLEMMQEKIGGDHRAGRNGVDGFEYITGQGADMPAQLRELRKSCGIQDGLAIGDQEFAGLGFEAAGDGEEKAA